MYSKIVCPRRKPHTIFYLPIFWVYFLKKSGLIGPMGRYDQQVTILGALHSYNSN